MPSVNKCILLGNLTRDVQLKFLPSQTAVAEFGMAMNRKYKSAGGEAREEVVFVDISAFGKSAETLNQYCHKGDLLYVEGRLKFDTWEDKNGGGKRSKLSVIVDTFQFMGQRSDGGEQQQPASRGSNAQSGRSPISAEKEFDESDIPF